MTITSAEAAAAPQPDADSMRIGHLFEWAQTSAGWRLSVIDDDAARRLSPTRLSPSTSHSMHGCATRWGVERVLPDDADPFAPAPIGTSGHTVMERLFELPAEERTQDRTRLILLDLADEEWKGDDVETRLNKAKWIEAVKDAIWGLFKIEDPTKVSVHSTEKALDDVLVEGVPFRGIIDRIDRIHEDPEDHSSPVVGYAIRDYKTGRDRDYHDDQLRVYAKAVEAASGKPVTEAYLYYTSTGKKRKVGLGPRLMKATLEAWTESWSMVNEYAGKRAYPTAPSALCGWCVLAKVCPSVSEVSLSERAQGMAATQPDPEALGLSLPIIQSTPTPAAEEAETGFEQQDTDGSPARPAAAHLEEENAAPESGTTENEDQTVSETPQPPLFREGKSYDEYVGDSLNANSYAAIAVSGTTAWAYQELKKADQPVSDETIDALAETFADIVLHVQYQATQKRSWHEGANGRARGFLHTYIEANPIPWGQDAEKWKTWKSRAKGHCTAMFKAALRLHQNESPRADAYLLFVPTESAEPEVDGFADPVSA